MSITRLPAGTYLVNNGPNHERLIDAKGRGREKIPMAEKTVTFSLQSLHGDDTSTQRMFITECDPAPGWTADKPVVLIVGFYFGIKFTGFYNTQERVGELQISLPRNGPRATHRHH